MKHINQHIRTIAAVVLCLAFSCLTYADAPKATTAPTAAPSPAVATAPAATTPSDAKADPKAEPKQAATSEPAKPAGELVAKVVWVKGELKAVSDDQKTRSLQKTDPIYLHDTLVTDEKTKAQIVFTDNSLMTFRPSTKFYIKEYKFDPKGKEESYIMNLLEGGFRTITGLIAKAHPTDYKIITPVATIGVRGTDYAVFLGEDGQLFVGQYKGTPCVSSTGKEDTLCLNNKTKYANVAVDGAAPVPLTQQPAVFNEKGEITNATFTDIGGNAAVSGGSITMPGSSGSGSSNIISSFCIN